MWCCCCPQEEESLQTNQTQNIKVNLIPEHEKTSKEKVTTSDNEMSRHSSQQQQRNQLSILVIKPSPTKQIQSVEDIRVPELSEDLPNHENRSLYRSALKSSDEAIKAKQRSELWLSQAGCKIFYNCFQKQEEMIFTFKISKHKIEETHPINYLLQPLKYSVRGGGGVRRERGELLVYLITSPKPISKYKVVLPQLVIEPHIKTIFGLSKPETQKLSKSYFESQFIYQIINMGKTSVRMQSIDKMVVSLREERNFDKMLSYCQKLTEQFDLEDMTKITFILPGFLTLSEIAQILSRLFRKFLVSQPLESTLKYLGYTLELVQSCSDQFEQVIILSNNIQLYQKQQMIAKEFQVKLQLALGLLMIEIDYNNFKVYENLMMNFLMDKTITDYLKFIQFVHKEKEEYLGQLEELKIFDQGQLEVIQKSRKISQKVISENQRYITIEHKHKRRYGDLFREYKNTKTPVEQLQKKKQWDDDLKGTQITFMQPQRRQLTPRTIEANIFQLINEDFIEAADLAVLPNEQQFQFREQILNVADH